MSPDTLWAAALGCAGLTLAAVVLLGLRWLQASHHAGREAPLPLPWAMRLVARPARWLEPLVATVVPAGRLERTTKRLESLGLSPPLSALRWEAIRWTQALLAATPVLVWGAEVRAWLAPLAAGAAYLLAGNWLERRREAQERHIGRELPAYLDLMTVCVEAGATLTSGIRLIVAQAPEGPLRAYFEHVLREIRGGRPRAQAFSHVAAIYGVESLGTLASALAHAEQSGMSLGQVLRTQAEQRTAERFARAEKLAMQAPVKMLGPLIFCIFPCTFIVIGVPIAVRLKEAFGS